MRRTSDRERSKKYIEVNVYESKTNEEKIKIRKDRKQRQEVKKTKIKQKRAVVLVVLLSCPPGGAATDDTTNKRKISKISIPINKYIVLHKDKVHTRTKRSPQHWYVKQLYVIPVLLLFLLHTNSPESGKSA